MIRIVNLTHGISINGINFPSNSLSFGIGNYGIIHINLVAHNTKLFSANYTDFVDENGNRYNSAQEVINVLLINNISTGGTVVSVNPGTNISIDNTDPKNPIVNFTGSSQSIIVVTNYSALPSVGIVNGKFYWVSSSQGTKWLPGSLGGTYYSAGLYYSNGLTWEYLDVPYQATQSEVNAGTNTDKFVTPASLRDCVYPYVIFRSIGVNAHRWKVTIDDTGMLSFPAEDLGI